MEPLFWQALIAITIGLSVYLSYKNESQKKTIADQIMSNIHWLTISGWVLWTLVVLSGLLMQFQLSVIFIVAAVGVFIIKSIRNRDQKVDKLEEAAKSIRNPNFSEAVLREKAKQDAEAEFVSRIYPIDGVQQLKAELILAIQSANERVLVMSGWASEYVIDEHFIKLCTKKLKDGTELHFGFGYNSSSSQRKSQWEKRGRSQIEKLIKKALDDGCDDNLYIYEFDNHYKSLVKDSDYFLTGSINWLSNKKGRNFERAWKTEIPELAKREFDDCITRMRPKGLIMRRKLLKPVVEWADE